MYIYIYIYIFANFRNISKLQAQIDYRFYITNYCSLHNMYIFRQRRGEIIKIIIKNFLKPNDSTNDIM